MAKKAPVKGVASDSSKAAKSNSAQHKHKDSSQEPLTTPVDAKRFAAKGLTAAIEARRRERQLEQASLMARIKRWLWTLKFRYDVLIGNYTFTSGECVAVNLVVLLVLWLLVYGAVQQLRLISALPQLRMVREYLMPSPQRSTS